MFEWLGDKFAGTHDTITEDQRQHERCVSAAFEVRPSPYTLEIVALLHRRICRRCLTSMRVPLTPLLTTELCSILYCDRPLSSLML